MITFASFCKPPCSCSRPAMEARHAQQQCRLFLRFLFPHVPSSPSPLRKSTWFGIPLLLLAGWRRFLVRRWKHQTTPLQLVPVEGGGSAEAPSGMNNPMLCCRFCCSFSAALRLLEFEIILFESDLGTEKLPLDANTSLQPTMPSAGNLRLVK